MHERVRHEREGMVCTCVYNVTKINMVPILIRSSLLHDKCNNASCCEDQAVSINWEDKEAQRSRHTLTIDDFLPSDRDGVVLQGNATRYIMEFLVSHFPSLGNLKQLVPARESLHPVEKSVVVPMKILFKDKK